MGQKKIECYIDCVSLFSLFAFSYLRRNRKALADLGVSVEFIPVFLGGINAGSGNQPPWMLPAKAAYSKYDTARAQKYFQRDFKVPPFFPIVSLLPQRCLVYAKEKYPAKYEDFFDSCFEALWNEQLDISKPENLMVAARKVFDRAQAEDVLKGGNHPVIKKALVDNTEHAVKDIGAYGCPWFWVHDGKGNEEPFFGSDRFHFMWDYLDIPHKDLELTPQTAKL